MNTAVLDLFTTALEVDGEMVATAQQTRQGWMWLTNTGRSSNKADYESKEKALRAAAKSLGLEITETVEG